jgi:hypothetical protein
MVSAHAGEAGAQVGTNMGGVGRSRLYFEETSLLFDI